MNEDQILKEEEDKIHHQVKKENENFPCLQGYY